MSLATSRDPRTKVPVPIRTSPVVAAAVPGLPGSGLVVPGRGDRPRPRWRRPTTCWSCRWNVRAAGLAVAGAASLVVLLTRVVLPLRWWTRPRTAAEIEGRFPQLGQRIRTVVQYAGLARGRDRRRGRDPEPGRCPGGRDRGRRRIRCRSIASCPGGASGPSRRWRRCRDRRTAHRRGDLPAMADRDRPRLAGPPGLHDGSRSRPVTPGSIRERMCRSSPSWPAGRLARSCSTRAPKARRMRPGRPSRWRTPTTRPAGEAREARLEKVEAPLDYRSSPARRPARPIASTSAIRWC